jgi:hypothetical protein
MLLMQTIPISSSFLEMRRVKMSKFRRLGIGICKLCLRGCDSVCDGQCSCVCHDLRNSDEQPDVQPDEQKIS